MPKTDIDEIRAALSYDAETGVFRWRVASGRAQPGEIAGNLQPNGRRSLSVNGLRYSAHHVAWAIVHGAWAAGYVKHRDEDFDHNWIDNLYEESPSDSIVGARVRKDSVSGHKGVTFEKGRGKWQVHLKRGSAAIFIGYYEKLTDAVAARQQAEQDHQRGDLDERFRHAAKPDPANRHRGLWRMVKANYPDHGWGGFTEFRQTVVDIPDVRLLLIMPADDATPIGPENFRVAERPDRWTGVGRRQYEQKRRADRPDLFKNNELKRAFGITIERYQTMLVEQKGVCAICGQPETMIRRGKVQSLSVDHNHETDAVRDLLCTSCNAMVGYSRERPDLLRATALYLERHTEPRPANIIPLPRKESA